MNRTWNRSTGFFGILGSVLLTALVSLGCGSSKDAVGGIAQYYGNYHKTGWISEHAGQAVAGVDACTKCHEISIIKVGSGVPTCMTTGCHHQLTPGFADPVVHGVRAKMAANAITGGSLVSCQICHAKGFTGGGSANACSSCHGVVAPHPPKPWRIMPGSVWTHTTADPSNAAVCAQCHFVGSPNNPVGHPATPAPAGTQPGCYNATLCHGANTAPHAVPFLLGQTDSSGNGHLNVTAAAFASDCATCHAYSGTSPTSSAPLCNVCHQLANPISAGTNAGTCKSCHTGTAGLPTGPGGTAYPSIAGAHVKHMALPTALSCDTCHGGSGTGTTTHYTNANARIAVPAAPVSVNIDLVFTAKTGGIPTLTGGSLTCSNVSCHGGQVTPGWQNGAINSATQCTACHGIAATAGVATQNNDAFGRHSLGSHNAMTAANGIACTTCHNMANGSPGALAHFKYLTTGAVDGVATGSPADQMPSGTIVFDPTIVTGAGTYSVTNLTEGNGGCALTCHTHIHVPAVNTWTASGAPHKVPFLTGDTDTQGNGHMNATQATFTADCGTCHAYSGASPHAESPLCVTCHTLANPVVPATGAGTCQSCHVGASGLPAGPTGAAFPNIAGAHAKHMGLPTTLTCDTCHAGAGTGTATHYTNANARVTTPTGPATVKMDATFNAQTGGPAAFNPTAFTCSASSCHGGQATPNWRTGTITSTSQCTLCHATNGGTTTSQYNDAVGRHAWGTHATAATLDCTICHDMSAGNTNPGAVKHFAELNTTPVSSTNKLPSGTIKFKLTNVTYPITGAATYNVTTPFTEGGGGCALTCHGQNHVPADNYWSAPKGSGVAHPVPFLSTDVSSAGNHHQTTTAAQFTAECSNCHDASGTTTTKTGPICTVCHNLGSPVATGMLAGTCLSCHTGASFTTVGPTGTAWPNLTGAHPKHLALLTFTRTTPALPASLTASAYPDCEACHVGAVPGDAANTHYSMANKRATVPKVAGPGFVQIDPTFNSQASTAGTLGTTALTCSNISCHGGQTTQAAWQNPGTTFTQNATTYCVLCHVVNAAEFNAPIGRHNNPTAHKDTCDHCHDMSTTTNNQTGVVNHFKYLDTTVVRVSPDQLSSDTIKFGGGTTPATGAMTYTVNATIGTGGCALTCHGKSHTASGNKWN
jgi:predicted CxxxxCH...CXXCH cytochrome family protein